MRRKDNIPSLMVINRAVKWFKLGESSRRLDEVNYSVKIGSRSTHTQKPHSSRLLQTEWNKRDQL